MSGALPFSTFIGGNIRRRLSFVTTREDTGNDDDYSFNAIPIPNEPDIAVVVCAYGTMIGIGVGRTMSYMSINTVSSMVVQKQVNFIDGGGGSPNSCIAAGIAVKHVPNADTVDVRYGFTSDVRNSQCAIYVLRGANGVVTPAGTHGVSVANGTKSMALSLTAKQCYLAYACYGAQLAYDPGYVSLTPTENSLDFSVASTEIASARHMGVRKNNAGNETPIVVAPTLTLSNTDRAGAVLIGAGW